MVEFYHLGAAGIVIERGNGVSRFYCRTLANASIGSDRVVRSQRMSIDYLEAEMQNLNCVYAGGENENVNLVSALLPKQIHQGEIEGAPRGAPALSPANTKHKDNRKN